MAELSILSTHQSTYPELTPLRAAAVTPLHHEALMRNSHPCFCPCLGQSVSCTYCHGDVPGHVNVWLEVVHPDLGGAQGVALCIVIDVVVVGLLGALDVRHAWAGQHLHAPPALPHLGEAQKTLTWLLLPLFEGKVFEYKRFFFSDAVCGVFASQRRGLLSSSNWSPSLPLAAHCRWVWGGCRWLHQVHKFRSQKETSPSP